MPCTAINTGARLSSAEFERAGTSVHHTFHGNKQDGHALQNQAKHRKSIHQIRERWQVDHFVQAANARFANSLRSHTAEGFSENLQIGDRGQAHRHQIVHAGRYGGATKVDAIEKADDSVAGRLSGQRFTKESGTIECRLVPFTVDDRRR